MITNLIVEVGKPFSSGDLGTRYIGH